MKLKPDTKPQFNAMKNSTILSEKKKKVHRKIKYTKPQLNMAVASGGRSPRSKNQLIGVTFRFVWFIDVCNVRSFFSLSSYFLTWIVYLVSPLLSLINCVNNSDMYNVHYTNCVMGNWCLVSLSFVVFVCAACWRFSVEIRMNVINCRFNGRWLKNQPHNHSIDVVSSCEKLTTFAKLKKKSQKIQTIS